MTSHAYQYHKLQVMTKADLYADHPLGNEEWTVKYLKDVDADKELERTLNDRFEGKVEINEC